MEFKHTSILFDEIMELLKIKEDGIYADGTLGGGGHSQGICQHLGEKGLLIGIDRDTDALNAASNRLESFSCQKEYVHNNYAEIKAIVSELELEGLDGALLDLGVSSFQLDNPERGFSYMNDAPLDMRMNQEDQLSAYDIVNTYSHKELFKIIKEYGEDKWAHRIAEFIVNKREDGPLTSTYELVDVIKAAVPAKARRDGPHPAKRTFQAIRIEVNNELGLLKKAVEDFVEVMNPGGRLCIITFHSLEDRIVKTCFNEAAEGCTCPKDFPICVCGNLPKVKKISRKPIIPSEEEIESNPRARSAKLRVIEKL